MAVRRYQFDRFSLDPAERRLLAGDVPVELNSRYFDALLLLLEHPGTLLSKERFLKDVWQGIPVTDEVLTQCIKILRRQLGDSATQPRLIETVPKHGYRFIAAVSCVADGDVAPRSVAPAAPAAVPRSYDWRQCWLTLGAGATGGGAAGLLGGVVFGFAAAVQAPQNDIGALSALLVLVAVTTLVALIGAAGVVGGIAAARLVARDFRFAGLAGGAAGGLLVGAFGKLIGHDALLLLFGHAPGNITGALEGLLLGTAVGLADDLARRYAAAVAGMRRSVLVAATIGALAGLLITVAGGRLFAGSLALLAQSFPDARLHLDPLGPLLGAFAAPATNALEGAWFSVCLVGALMLARR
ncbi:MAG TPA: transcriptional regulator [Gammaproteobacteria bacterium]|nr:transcriptional regulator [Gammaproteobacteria bacterium]